MEKNSDGLKIRLSPRATRKIDKIILHCTATPEGRGFSVSDIRRWHLARGFSDIGYHYVVYLDGSVHEGRQELKMGAHTLGLNSNSIGIAYVGGCASDGKTPKDTRTEAQKASLVALVRRLRNRYPGATVHGHNEFAAKACPSFKVDPKEFD